MRFTRQEIWEHCERAARLVKSWPEWKQHLLAHSRQPTVTTPRKPVDNTSVIEKEIMRNRPSWHNFLLGLAKFVSARSSDEETQHGTVIVDKVHRIIATGCNGFPRGMKNDEALPATRPDKYPWMIHSEVNAACSTNTPLEGSTAYVTGKPCFQCVILMWQHGVKKIVHIDGYGWAQDEQERANQELFLVQSGMVIHPVKPDLSWVVDFVLKDRDLGPLVREAVRNEPPVTKGSREQMTQNKTGTPLRIPVGPECYGESPGIASDGNYAP